MNSHAGCRTADLLGETASIWLGDLKWARWWGGSASPKGSVKDDLVAKRRQEELGPGVRASRCGGEGVPELEEGEADFSI